MKYEYENICEMLHLLMNYIFFYPSFEVTRLKSKLKSNQHKQNKIHLKKMCRWNIEYIQG